MFLYERFLKEVISIKSYFRALCAMIDISITSVWSSNVSPQVGSPFFNVCAYWKLFGKRFLLSYLFDPKASTIR